MPRGAGHALPDPAEPITLGFDAPIHSSFLRQAARTPDAAAVHDRDGTWSYRDVERASRALAKALRDAGIRRGDVVGIYTHRCAALVPAMLGTLRSGAAFTMLNPLYPASRLAALIEASRPRAFVALEAAGPVSPEVESALAAVHCAPAIRFSSSPPPSPAPEEAGVADLAEPEVTGDDLAYVAFTSGTTGRPKGIVGIHRPVLHFVDWHVGTFGFQPGDRFAMLAGLAHDVLLRDVFTPLAVGASVRVPDELRRADVLREWLRTEQVTALHLTASHAEILVHGARPGETLPHLRHLFFGAEPLQGSLVTRMRALAPAAHVVLFYGATETPQAIAFHPVEAGDERGLVPIGRGIDAVQLLVLTEDGRLAAPGELGEIHVRTPYLAKGYLGDPGLTARCFVTNPFTGDPSDRVYRTGDLGRYRPDGVVEFAGRRDDQVKILGYRVELGEVVSALLTHPEVSRATAELREDPAGEGPGEPGRKLLVAYVVPRKPPVDPRRLARDLREHLKGILPEIMVPSFFVTLDAFPMTPNGKVDRAALPAPDRKAATTREPAPPTDDLESQLLSLWKRLLRVDRLGIDDNFFELGGDSLRAVQLVAAIESELQRRMSLGALFEKGTIRAVAASLREGAGQPRSIVVPLAGEVEGPALFCICGVNLYQRLADRLAHALRVYGIFLPYEQELFDEARVGPVEVESVAAGYVRAIRERQPGGPYLLAGLSFGGVLAYEVAQQLVRAGEEVRLVALLDSVLPGAVKRSPWRRALRFLGRTREQGLGHVLGDAARGITSRRSAWARSAAVDPIAAEALRLDEVRRSGTRSATRRYRPRPYDGRVLLVRATDRSFFGGYETEPSYGWGPLVARLSICDVPGDHDGILDEPQVGELAEHLLAHVRAAGAPAEARPRTMGEGRVPRRSTPGGSPLQAVDGAAAIDAATVHLRSPGGAGEDGPAADRRGRT